jgi:hypothetical protein
MMAAVVLVLGFASFASAQTRPTQVEIDQWKKEPGILRNVRVQEIAWLLESERTASAELPKQPIRYALGWWGRGFFASSSVSPSITSPGSAGQVAT